MADQQELYRGFTRTSSPRAAASKGAVLERKYKILLAGDPKAGKTQFAEKTDSCFPFKPYGVSIGKTTRSVPDFNAQVTLILWTLTVGRPKDTTYFHGARAAIVVGNLAHRETVMNMRQWADAILDFFTREANGKVGRIPIVFVGMQTGSASLVNIDTLKRIARDYGGVHYLIRPDDRLVFERILNRLAKLLLELRVQDSPDEQIGGSKLQF